MSVNFCAAIFEESSTSLKIIGHCSAITSQSRMSGCGEAGTNPGGILVKDKNCEDVAEYHSSQDQADAAQKEESAGAKWSKRFVSLRKCVRSTHACVLRGAHCFHCPRVSRKIPLVFRRQLARPWHSLGTPA